MISDKLIAETDRFLAQRLQRGRDLVAIGQVSPDGIADWYDVHQYRLFQRERAQWRGCCDYCDTEHLLHTLPDGSQVCRHTFEPCQRRSLAAILHLYERAFQ